MVLEILLKIGNRKYGSFFQTLHLIQTSEKIPHLFLYEQKINIFAGN